MRKVPFSHPLAHLDPKFSMKTQLSGSSHQAEGGGSGTAMDDFDTTPNPHKRPHEVLLSPTPSHPQAGLFKQHLNLSDSDYQESTQSSDDSSGGLAQLIIKEGYVYI
jgi:hypothetical protein